MTHYNTIQHNNQFIRIPLYNTKYNTNYNSIYNTDYNKLRHDTTLHTRQIQHKYNTQKKQLYKINYTKNQSITQNQQGGTVNRTSHNCDNYSHYQANTKQPRQEKDESNHRSQQDVDNRPTWIAKRGKQTFPSDKNTKTPAFVINAVCFNATPNSHESRNIQWNVTSIFIRIYASLMFELLHTNALFNVVTFKNYMNGLRYLNHRLTYSKLHLYQIIIQLYHSG